MCGIAAIVSHLPNDLLSIQKMTDIISHRGPDGSGFYCEKNIALGHRKLEILDGSFGAEQPMHFFNKYVITYNGQIYNYQELKAELLKKGYRFNTETDTEVLLAAYDFWKEDCLNHFNGMFSFVLFNKEENLAFCARDRFGVKPFYYYEQNDCIAFASEIKQFTVFENWIAEANQQRAYEYLQFGWQDHSNETLFKNVYQLKAGHYLILELKNLQKNTKQWYDLNNCNGDAHLNNDVQKFSELFHHAVYLQLSSDKKTGACLSGGMDSSSIVVAANAQIRKDGRQQLLETVSCCFEDIQFEESVYITSVVEKENCINHKVFPDLGALYQQLDTIIWQQDEPFGSMSILAQWELFKKAKQEKIKIMLDGQGADEWLAGYHSFYGVYFCELLRKGNLNALLSEIKALKKTGLYTNKIIAKEIIKNLLPLSSWLFFKRCIQAEKKWINYKYANSIIESDRSASIKRKSYEQIKYHLPQLLHWQDRNSMAFSIEARVPFLDYRLVEFGYQLTPEKKINNGVTKFILRNVMNELLPKKVLNRKDKMGFVTPEEYWIKENAASIRKDLEKAHCFEQWFYQ